MSRFDLFLAAVLALLAGAVAAFVWVVAASRRRGAGWGRLVAGNLLLLLAGLAAVLAGLEIRERFFRDETDGYQVTLTSLRWVERHYRMNEFGVRDDVEYALERTAGRPRVTFLGDSFTNGYGVADVRDRFVNRIREARPGWEVHALAEDGLDTGPAIELLGRRTAAGYELDHLVYVYMLNDASDLVEEWNRAAARLYAERPPAIVSSSFAVNAWYYRLRVARDPALVRYFDWLAEAYTGSTWRLQARRLAELRRVVEERGGRLLVVTFPFFETRDDPRFSAAQGRLATVWAALEVPHLDLGPAFAGIPTEDLAANPRDTHPNPFAHRLAAEAMLSFLEQHVGTGTAAP